MTSQRWTPMHANCARCDAGPGEPCPHKPASPAPSEGEPVDATERERLAVGLILLTTRRHRINEVEVPMLERAAAMLRSAPESERSWVEQHATELAETADRLRRACEKAAQRFREYEAMHTAKGAVDKAARNALYARDLEVALAAAPAGPTDPAGSGPYCPTCGASAEDRERYPCGGDVACPMRSVAPAGEPAIVGTLYTTSHREDDGTSVEWWFDLADGALAHLPADGETPLFSAPAGEPREAVAWLVEAAEYDPAEDSNPPWLFEDERVAQRVAGAVSGRRIVALGVLRAPVAPAEPWTADDAKRLEEIRERWESRMAPAIAQSAPLTTREDIAWLLARLAPAPAETQAVTDGEGASNG